jgi:hypothetical protein
LKKFGMGATFTLFAALAAGGVWSSGGSAEATLSAPIRAVISRLTESVFIRSPPIRSIAAAS